MASSYWLSEAAWSPPPPRAREGRVDVAIVGGGVTGCAAARVLAQAGLRVRVHEAREIASGASGRNGGFALRGGAMAHDRGPGQVGGERAARPRPAPQGAPAAVPGAGRGGLPATG